MSATEDVNPSTQLPAKVDEEPRAVLQIPEKKPRAIPDVDPGRSLNQGQFRLLYLEERDGEADPNVEQPVSCRVQTFDLFNAPPYRALSYVCGKPYLDCHWEGDRPIFNAEDEELPSATAHVICHGNPFPVYPNLADALVHLQALGFSGWLWVDAICIRQDDPIERASQILLMTTIYSQAEVLVWFGPDNPHVDAVIELTVTTLPKMKSLRLSDQRIYTLGDPALPQLLGTKEISSKMLRFTWFIHVCRWFGRVWTLQEIVSTTKKPRFFCGMKEINGLGLVSLFEEARYWGWESQLNLVWLNDAGCPSIRYVNLGRLSGASERSVARCWRNSIQLLCDNPDFHDASDSIAVACSFMELAWALLISSLADCYDQRDRVYAVMGVVQRSFKGDLADYISVSYQEDVEHVYCRVTKEILTHSLCLDVLSYSCRPRVRAKENLPSWVADYRVKIRYRPLVAMRDLVVAPLNAAAGIPHRGPIFTVHDTSVGCFGACFDEIVAQMDIDIFSPPENTVVQMVQFTHKLPEQLNGRHRIEVLWKTLIHDYDILQGDQASDGVCLGMQFAKCVQLNLASTEILQSRDRVNGSLELCRRYQDLVGAAFLSPMFEHDDGHSNILEQLAAYYSVTQGWQDAEKTEHDWRHFEDSKRLWVKFLSLLNSTLGGRRLFITKRGLLGLGTDNTAVGDQIWILAGAHTPFVLEPTDSRDDFRFVGDCFMLDHMNGEILSQKSDVRQQLKDVNLV